MAKKELIQIRVTNEQKKYIKKLSIDRDMTVSEFLLYAVMQVIRDEELINLKESEKNND